jgi:hypothetical protein
MSLLIFTALLFVVSLLISFIITDCFIASIVINITSKIYINLEQVQRFFSFLAVHHVTTQAAYVTDILNSHIQ